MVSLAEEAGRAPGAPAGGASCGKPGGACGGARAANPAFYQALALRRAAAE
ncbi:hypothetical protein BURPSS13_I0569 [Burkholderia pseudomallei S13]|nr:hypothetical protein BURPSS13_I0569 [Burkholderia pseudomallei S13]